MPNNVNHSESVKQQTSKKAKRRYTGVGVLIVTNYLEKPYIVLGMEKGKSKKYYSRISKFLDKNKKKDKNTGNMNIASDCKKSQVKENDSEYTSGSTSESTSESTSGSTSGSTSEHTSESTSGSTSGSTSEHKNNKSKKHQIHKEKTDKDKTNKEKTEMDDKLNRHVFLYEEFGGGIQNTNLTLEENACFELNEETCNLVNFTNPFILNKGMNTFFDIPYLKDRIYRLYVVFIPDFTQVIHLFYKNMQILKSAPSTYYKFRNYCEMTDMSIIELDHIYKYKDNLDNYVCFNAEENLYNQIIHDKGKRNFRGILRCPDNVFISSRLVEFLNMNFVYDKGTKGYTYYNGDITKKDACKNVGVHMNLKNKPNMIAGLDFCNYIYQQGMYAVKHNFADNYINFTKPRKTNKQNAKYSFLGRTWCVDGF
jgi:hypothetical protein